MDVDTTSQTLQASETLDNVYEKSFRKDNCLKQKCKLLFLTWKDIIWICLLLKYFKKILTTKSVY